MVEVGKNILLLLDIISNFFLWLMAQAHYILEGSTISRGKLYIRYTNSHYFEQNRLSRVAAGITLENIQC